MRTPIHAPERLAAPGAGLRGRRYQPRLSGPVPETLEDFLASQIAAGDDPDDDDGSGDD